MNNGINKKKSPRSSIMDFFSSKGRLNRLSFLGWIIRLLLVSILIYSIVYIVLKSMMFNQMLLKQFMDFTNLIVFVIIIIKIILLSIKRLHDYDESGWWLLGGFIYYFILSYIFNDIDISGNIKKTIIYIILIIGPISVLIFQPGTNSKNKYGIKP